MAPPDRKRMNLLMAMALIMAFLDMLGVASIMPLITVLSAPELIHTNTALNFLFTTSRFAGIETIAEFQFLMGVATFALLLASLSFKAWNTMMQARFIRTCEFNLSKRLLEGYLQQPYAWFLDRHSADLGKTILSEVGAVVGSGISPLMVMSAQAIVSFSLVILLIVVDPVLALSVGVVLGIAYAGILTGTSSWIKRLGQSRIKANQERFTAVSEAFGATKEVKARGLERFFTQRFAQHAEVYATGQATAQVIAQLPRFALEAIAFGGILLIILYLMVQEDGFLEALPTIALYAFSAYRLMPALQQIYSSTTQFRYAGPAIDALHKDLIGQKVLSADYGYIAKMSLTRDIELNQVSFCYPNATQPALKGIDLTIPVFSTVGFVGATGSGKTTTADVILGLLEPQEGALSIDGQLITASNRRKWQRAIGYVPQHIYLADDTVAANIAFGQNGKDIDQRAVERAAKIANLHEFVVNDLPQGYATTVGERGVRLSGGQRQRIGIARALYHNPQVLILDEATSAVDNLTEQAVMEAVSNLGHDITIILIAHRLSTVRQCDQIYLLERGEVKDQGTYEELTASSQQFRAMAGAVE